MESFFSVTRRGLTVREELSNKGVPAGEHELSQGSIHSVNVFLDEPRYAVGYISSEMLDGEAIHWYVVR